MTGYGRPSITCTVPVLGMNEVRIKAGVTHKKGRNMVMLSYLYGVRKYTVLYSSTKKLPD